MLEMLGGRQRELLALLLKNKAGMTADELSERLGITRNAVRQHLAALENDRLLTKGVTRASGGRPEQLYVLTDKGHECFPRHYSWFAQLLVESLEEEMGTAGFAERVASIGQKVGRQLAAQHAQAKNTGEKVRTLSGIMEELGYSARKTEDASGASIVEADNCVFHDLAVKNPEVCRFDLALMATFTGSEVDHEECMAKGGHLCRFKFNDAKK